MNSEIKADRIADARDTLCPGPFWELIKVYSSAKEDDVISLYSTEEYDIETKTDAPVWIDKTGNKLIGVFDREGYYEIMMRKTKKGR
ncbi:hypothetical protein IX51_11105 [uncultured archaeon]|nr:hypothetical protein IX51_11105 [uncultured archaeon]